MDGAAPAVDDGPSVGAVAAVAIMVVVVVLNVVGLVMVLSSSSVLALQQYGTAWYFFVRQLIWAVLGGAVMLVAWRVDHRRLRMFTRALLLANLAALFVVLVPGVGITVSGSTRWIGVGPLVLQPSELMKFTLAAFFADLLARRGDRLDDWQAGLLPVGLVLGLTVALVMKQPDMGTTMIIVVIAAAAVFVAGVRLRVLAKLAAGAVALATVAAMAEPYRRDRMLNFRHPFRDAGGQGYQLAQSLVGLGTGSLTGLGLGQSRAKWGFLPNAHTDFIFAIIGEEAGLAGSLAVVALFAVVAVLGVRAAQRAPDRFGMVLATCITAWIVGQAAINIGAVIGLLPVTGVPLPLVSFGGSSLVISMGAMGVLANIARVGGDHSGERARGRRPARGRG